MHREETEAAEENEGRKERRRKGERDERKRERERERERGRKRGKATVRAKRKENERGSRTRVSYDTRFAWGIVNFFIRSSAKAEDKNRRRRRIPEFCRMLQ